MADVYRTIYGPAVPDASDERAFDEEGIRVIAARRAEADAQRKGPEAPLAPRVDQPLPICRSSGSTPGMVVVRVREPGSEEPREIVADTTITSTITFEVRPVDAPPEEA